MAQQPISFNSFRGLYLQPNSFSQIPDGSLEVAENVSLIRDGILQKRRGFYEFANSINNAKGIFEYANALFLVAGTGAGHYDSSANYTANGGTGSWSTISPRTTETNSGVLLITSDNGVLRLESLTDSLAAAGVPPGLDLLLTTSGQSGYIPADSKMAYRVCFSRQNAEFQTERSSPSALATIANNMLTGKSATYSTTVDVTVSSHGCTGTVAIVVKNAKTAAGVDVASANGSFTATVVDANTLRYTPTSAATGLATLDVGWAKTVTVVASLPSGLSTSFKYEVYRTEYSTDEAVEPDEDTLQLVYTANLTASDVSNGYLSFSDTVDDLFRGAYCYTNPNTGEGIANANDQPPVCTDVALFKGRLWYSNITTKFAYSVNLISAATMQVNDVLSISRGGVTRTYTAKASETSASREFKRTSGSGSIGYDIGQTAESLCRVINRDSSGLVYAYYVSGVLDVPGQIILRERTNSGVAFTVQFSRASVFSPDVYTTATATNNEIANAVMYSKADEPVAVPSYQYLMIGSRDEAILRIVPLRDSLIVIKERSVHRISGDGVTFLASVIDNTIGCKAVNSVCSLNNVVYFCSEQGVIGVTETAAQVVSREIEPLLTSVVGSPYFSQNTRMIGYESDRSLLLCTIKPGSTTADVVYVRNSATSSWTTSTELFSDALVSRTDDKLILLQGTTLLKERKNLNRLDYTGRAWTISVNDVASDKLSSTFTALGTSEPIVGDCIVYSGVIHVITAAAADGAATRYYFKNPVNFSSLDNVGHYQGIESRIRIAPLTLGSVSHMKHISECQIHSRNGASLSQLQVSFISDSSAGSSEIEWQSSTGSVGWGLERWGLFAWGEENTTTLSFETKPGQLVRTWVPTETARATWIQTELAHKVAGESMDLQSIGFVTRPYGQKTSK